MSTVVPLGVYINSCSGISIVTVANYYLSIYDSTVNLWTSAVHVVLVVFIPLCMKNAGLADPLLWNTEVQKRDTKNTESTICIAKILLSVLVSEFLLLGCSFGTMVLNKIVSIPLFQRWELILTDRNRYDWLTNIGIATIG
jgi:hypothetical protein